VRALVDYLHKHDQHYIVMVDPAVAHANGSAFQRGVQKDVFMRHQDGSLYKGTNLIHCAELYYAKYPN
jgi:alpha-glucosidase